MRNKNGGFMMDTKSILLVEDDSAYGENLKNILEDSGYDVVFVADSITAIEMLYTRPFNIIISDLMLDAMDGLRLIKYVQGLIPNIKSIILTGFPSAESELQSLDIRVDRYFEKRVRKDILLKYIEVLLDEQEKERMFKSTKASILFSQNEGIEMRDEEREVRKNGKMIELTNKEYEILRLFLENRNIALSREDIIENVWENQLESVDLRVVDTHIKGLRKKLRISSLKSVRGFGYKWTE